MDLIVSCVGGLLLSLAEFYGPYRNSPLVPTGGMERKRINVNNGTMLIV